MTHADLGRIDEADPAAVPKAADQKTAQKHQATLQQLNKPVIADQPGKIRSLMPQHLPQVIVLKRPVTRKMKPHHNRHYLT